MAAPSAMTATGVDTSGAAVAGMQPGLPGGMHLGMMATPTTTVSTSTFMLPGMFIARGQQVVGRTVNVSAGGPRPAA